MLEIIGTNATEPAVCEHSETVSRDGGIVCFHCGKRMERQQMTCTNPMTTIEASWRARWKAIAKYYRTLYFAPVTADCPQAGQRAQVTNFCANCEATERRITELRTALAKQDHEVGQVLGRALGYPRFADDQKNFPGATDADGVCVGEHVAETLASEAAERIKTLTGAMAAQDGRERAAGALCGIPYEEHGCDWPDAVAERLVAVRGQRDAAQADAAALRQAVGAWLSYEHEFVAVFMRGLEEIKDSRKPSPELERQMADVSKRAGELRREIEILLVAPNPGESLLAELTGLQSFTTLQTAASARAISLWQAAHPDRSDIWPDQAALLVWLLEQLDALRAERDGLEARLRMVDRVMGRRDEGDDGMAEW